MSYTFRRACQRRKNIGRVKENESQQKEISRDFLTVEIGSKEVGKKSLGARGKDSKVDSG